MYKAGCLRSGSLPLTKIAKAVGYQTDSAFNKVFSRHYGVPPAAYRRSLAAADEGLVS